MSVKLQLCILSLALTLSLPASAANCVGASKSLYVKSTATSGNGSQNEPFNSLIAAQNASCPGDTIYILPSPASNPALDGGITLKDNQKLIGVGPNVTKMNAKDASPKITNTSGDAITLANNNVVSNIEIAEPLGGGIMAIDKSNGELRQLLIRRSQTTPVPRYNQSLCFIALDANSNIDYVNSNLVGCAGFFNPGPAITSRKSAINLLAEDFNGKYTLKDIIIEDGPVSIISSARVWNNSIRIRASSTTLLEVNADNITANRSNTGIAATAVDRGKVNLQMHNINVHETINDGVTAFTGFACAGLAPDTNVFGVTCEEAFGSPIPVSHAEVIASLDGYVFRGLDRLGSGNDSYSMGVEIGGQDQGTSRVEFHMQNADITGAPMAAFDLEQPAGYLSADSIVDLGCLVNECKVKGYTSIGKNRMYENGVNALASQYGPDRQAVLGSTKVQLWQNGADNNASNNILYAQGNYWGGFVMEPSSCVVINGITNERIGPIPNNANCIRYGNYLNIIPSYFDANFPLFN